MTDKHWYIVQAYSNFERKVADSIREQAKQRHLDHLFDEVMVPTEKVVEVRRGQKVDAERKFFPGYVLVKMDLTDEAYHLIKNTPKVTGFLGADNKPKPISEAEAARILHQVQEGIERPKPSVSFEVGEQVRVPKVRSRLSTASWKRSTTAARGSRLPSPSSGADAGRARNGTGREVVDGANRNRVSEWRAVSLFASFERGRCRRPPPPDPHHDPEPAGHGH
jgi:transcriptional antiterminator NusG